MKLLILVFVSVFVSQAHGACTSPSGDEGAMNYDTSQSRMELCDGTNWNNIAGGNSSVEVILKSADDSITTDIVLNNDSDLAFSLAANEKVQVEILAIVTTSNSAPDIQFDLTGPASPVNVVFFTYWTNHVADPPGACGDVIFAYNSVVDCNWGTNASTGAAIVFKGTIENGINAGTVNLRWAQRSSSANTTILKKGSYIKVTRL